MPVFLGNMYGPTSRAHMTRFNTQTTHFNVLAQFR